MNGNGENKELNSNDFETDNSGTADIKEQDEEATFGWGWRIICILFALTAVVYLFALIIPSFADFMSEKVGAVIRYALAIPTNILPFSLAEIILILLPFALVALVVFACIKHCGTWKRVFAFSGKILCVGMVIMMLYMCGFGPGYHGTTIDKKLGLDKQPVSEDELYDLVFVLSSNINTLAEKVEYDEATDFSVMPYSYGEMNAKLLSAYETVSETYPFIPVMRSRVKPVMLSKLMSYTHMTGVYSFFTGEANFNTDFPDYTTPFTAAHELAHQRGVAREDEASFVAYLVCMASDDD